MKCILILFTLSCSVLFAQNERYSIGAYYGIGLSATTNYYTKTAFNGSDLKSTFDTGIDVRRQMGQKGFYLQTGLRWNGYGWKNLYLYNKVVSTSNSTKLSFVSVPLITTLKLNKILKGLNLSAGPQISFFSYRKWKNREGVLAKQWDLPDLAFSVFMSVGYEYALNDKWLVGGVIYSNLIPREVYNYGVALSLRYVFKEIQ